MDQDLIAYLERRFSALEQRIEQRIDQQVGTLREETAQRFSEADQQRQTLREETAQGFRDADRRVETLREETARGFREANQRVETLREETLQGFSQVDQHFTVLEADVRGAYVAIEDLRGNVRLVAEGVANGAEQMKRSQEEVSRRFSDMESLFRQSYADLDSRVRKLEKAG
jgi:vacuolar-type H+-ATPase subunit H